MKRKENYPTKHHRKCRSNGGNSEARNISIVSNKQHEAWHTLFENKDPYEIVTIINRVWIDPDFEFVCIPRHNYSLLKTIYNEKGSR